MASEVADHRVSKCGLRPRCRDFPRAKTPPHPDEAHGGREVPKSGKKKQRRGKILARRGDTRGKGKMEWWCRGRMA